MKGARELLRHYSLERHLRKDQRWRYEYLSVIDTVTGVVKHRVRGEDGELLTPYQLELELPEFIDTILVDIGDKEPFYEDYIAGQRNVVTSPDNRVRVQICVLGSFLPVFGDLSVFRGLWRNLGIVMGQEASYLGFKWGKEQLSVSFRKASW